MQINKKKETARVVAACPYCGEEHVVDLCKDRDRIYYTEGFAEYPVQYFLCWRAGRRFFDADMKKANSSARKEAMAAFK